MSTLLLRLAAPMQAWGASAKFNQRETQRLPTKSGVVGLLAAALGRRRDESLEDLNTLIMGVRADQEGELLRDFQTVQTQTNPYVTNRYYLCDAVFVVGLQGDSALLSRIDEALKRPFFPLFLGRRSCPPVGRVSLGIRQGLSVSEALSSEPWQASVWYQKQNQGLTRLTLLLEAPPGSPGTFFLRDAPISFSQARRQHGFRSLRAGSIQVPRLDTWLGAHGVDETAHDAFMVWEG